MKMEGLSCLEIKKLVDKDISGYFQNNPSSLNFEIDQNFNAILYVLNGKINVNEHAINGKQMLWFENDGQEINVKATEESRFIILSGEPLNEKVVSHGPFVMNNEQEIYQAIDDYQNNKMGTLKEVF